jgi:ABC-2 type transport system permease protein
MKPILMFIRKEFYHIFRDKRTMLIIIGIPVIQIILIGFAISTEVKNVQVAVYDPSNDISTQRIIERLNASEYFEIVKILDTPQAVDNVFKEGKINFVIVFSEHFNEQLYHTGEAAIQLIADATDPNQATTVTAYASNVIMDYQQELIPENAVPFQIQTEIRMLYNPGLRSSYYFVPGLMGMIFTLICAMMTSIAIVREKETGTMEVLLASPLKPLYIILSKMIPYFLISWFIFMLVLLLSVFILDIPVTGNLIGLNVFTLIFILVVLSLGLLISTLVKTQVAAMLVSGMGLMLPIMILSGFVFPIGSMPPILQWLSCIIPARWYIAGARKLMIEGVPMYQLTNEIVILTGMAIVIIMISLKKFKTRL